MKKPPPHTVSSLEALTVVTVIAGTRTTAENETIADVTRTRTVTVTDDIVRRIVGIEDAGKKRKEKFNNTTFH
uniref:Uncharacterized protein n=1 Tax=Caenorhabditis japonica TaxID=281687 RepID=A0A8R1EMJ2_CAEJA